ncbi:MAG: hypothetical protein DWQ04_26730 [Chloroflexi bacterium]|nr:MAG: hypothetical protein DWQ04_26730 [Chloroflexota bacterium]
MPDVPINSPLGYVGVVLLLFGFFLILAGSGIVKIEKITVSQGAKTWGFGGFMVIVGVIFLLPEILGKISNSMEVPAIPETTPTSTNISSPITEVVEVVSTETFTPQPANTPLPTSTRIPFPATASITFPQNGAFVDQSIYVKGDISYLGADERAFLIVESA